MKAGFLPVMEYFSHYTKAGNGSIPDHPQTWTEDIAVQTLSSMALTPTVTSDTHGKGN